jgi:hypothetical protein
MGIQVGKELVNLPLARLSITGDGSDANVFEALGNPYGIDVYIVDAWVVVTTVATAAATLDIGPANGATTASDTLFDGLDVNAATGCYFASNDTHNGTNGGVGRLWSAGNYLTVKEASGNVAGLVAVLLARCVPTQ